MDDAHDGKALSPYVGGALTGLLMVLSVWFTGKFFGASTTFAKSAGMLEMFFGPGHVRGVEYFAKYVPAVDWQWMFVVGIFLGSAIASILGGTWKPQHIPDMWVERFGTRATPRALAAFGGGILALFGARLAGGCPSGHGLSGMLQLSISGFVSLVCFFAAGAVVARILYRGGK